jgi:hypothetical protein
MQLLTPYRYPLLPHAHLSQQTQDAVSHFSNYAATFLWSSPFSAGALNMLVTALVYGKRNSIQTPKALLPLSELPTALFFD